MQTEPNVQRDSIRTNNGTTTAPADARVAELNRVVDQAEELLRSLSDTGGEAVAAARERVRHTLHDAKEKLSDTGVKARDFANRTATKADEYVHANPWRAVALGALAGAVATLLIAGTVRR
ncbi:MAG TPA: DUF883 family protein [Steroidobacteraceae bacterium]|nr:DUF883 family protein [Steroidobacteraceae bacterium]HRX90000.1 DUF883 family protein [Steroidobacteraceae bacterium]